MEIIVAVSILSIMAAGLALRTSGMIDKGRTAKVINLVDTLKTACGAYYLDTNAYANEYSGYTAPNRKLSATQTISGWSGPYLDAPLTHDKNPFGGSMHLYGYVTPGSWISGFDIDADGSLDVTGQACMLYLSNVSAEAAEVIDEKIDAGLPGSWEDLGRVVYQSSNKRLLILVFN